MCLDPSLLQGGHPAVLLCHHLQAVKLDLPLVSCGRISDETKTLLEDAQDLAVSVDRAAHMDPMQSMRITHGLDTGSFHVRIEEQELGLDQAEKFINYGVSAMVFLDFTGGWNQYLHAAGGIKMVSPEHLRPTQLPVWVIRIEHFVKPVYECCGHLHVKLC